MFVRLTNDIGQWSDIKCLLEDSLDWLRRVRSLHNEWSALPLDEQIKKCEVTLMHWFV